MQKFVLEIALFIYRTKTMRKEGLVVSFKMTQPFLKLRNQSLGRLAAHFKFIDFGILTP